MSGRPSEEDQISIGTTIDMVGPKDSIRKGILAEKFGYDSLWFTDHLIDNGGIKVEPWTTISAIATQTRRIKMCTAVTDTQRSHPARTAHSVATLDEISDGRVNLGIGAGEAMNLVPFGMPFDKPIARARRLAEAVQVIRLLWGSSRANPVSFKGEFFTLDNAWLDVKASNNPKIFVGALGGRHALEAAGKYGDGWISWVNTPETFRERLGIAREAAKRAGRNEEEITGSAWLFTSIAEDDNSLRVALDYTKRSLLVEAHTLKRLGVKIPPELDTPYQSMLVSDRVDKAVLDLQNTVSDRVAMDCAATGTVKEIVDKIHKFHKAGASNIILEFVDQSEHALRDYSSKVLPFLRDIN